jgi:hypothetical protein
MQGTTDPEFWIHKSTTLSMPSGEKVSVARRETHEVTPHKACEGKIVQVTVEIEKFMVDGR